MTGFGQRGALSISNFACPTTGLLYMKTSHLIKSICQAAIKYYNSKCGEDFYQIKVLLLAPTGNAALIIKGNTIHSLLAVPASQSLKNYKPLDCSRQNTLRSQIGGAKLILLHEISMVGSNMLQFKLIRGWTLKVAQKILEVLVQLELEICSSYNLYLMVIF